jgi:hypothetical protein
VLRLETSLGGGKTHNLIALFHAAQGRLSQVRAAEFMDPGLLTVVPRAALKRHLTQIDAFPRRQKKCGVGVQQVQFLDHGGREDGAFEVRTSVEF